jgi:hypothetical protein
LYLRTIFFFTKQQLLQAMTIVATPVDDLLPPSALAPPHPHPHWRRYRRFCLYRCLILVGCCLWAPPLPLFLTSLPALSADTITTVTPKPQPLPLLFQPMVAADTMVKLVGEWGA